MEPGPAVRGPTAKAGGGRDMTVTVGTDMGTGTGIAAALVVGGACSTAAN
ncbi:hypothetical protein [Sphingomonas faeni]